MTQPLSLFVSTPGSARTSGFTINTDIIDRYVTEAEAAFAKPWIPYINRFWEAGRNLGADNEAYVGNGKDEFDAIGGQKFSSTGSILTPVAGGPTVPDGFLALDPGGVNANTLIGEHSDIFLTGDNPMTLIIVCEFDTIPAGARPIIGSNAADPGYQALASVVPGGSGAGDFSVDNGQVSPLGIVTLPGAFAAGRRDIVWFAFNASAKVARLGRRSATVGTVAATWATHFHSSIRGERLGGVSTGATAFTGRLLARFRAPTNLKGDDVVFQRILDSIATHYNCAP